MPVKKGQFIYDSCRIFEGFSLKRPERGRILETILVEPQARGAHRNNRLANKTQTLIEINSTLFISKHKNR
jgi:hypothetical protein